MTDHPLPPPPRRGMTWQELRVGDRHVTHGRTILGSEIRAFVNLTGMIEPLFTDFPYSAAHGALKGELSPGAYVLSVAEGLALNATVSDTGLALLGFETRFRAPVTAGDTIRVEIEVLASRARAEGADGIVTTRNRVFRQDGAEVLTYTVTRLISGG